VDTTFGETDFQSNSEDVVYAAALQPDRRLVAAGTTRVGLDLDFALARYENPTPVTCRVPNVRSKKLRAARSAITKAHCRVGKVRRKASKRIKRGRVISQSPKAGTKLPNRGKVNLVVSRGRAR
jgi:PASTA domain